MAAIVPLFVMLLGWLRFFYPLKTLLILLVGKPSVDLEKCVMKYVFLYEILKYAIGIFRTQSNI